jgi:putative membrane-bound dehydrogenase-like protein
MQSRHQGHYWIGGYEKYGDKPTGTLTSVPFVVTHPWASFLVGGGPWPETCVELMLWPEKRVIFRASGLEEEDLRRVVVDLQPYRGQQIVIRLVDRHSGHWGHINFDDFRFHSQRPNFPERPKKEPLPPPDVYKYAGLPAEQAAKVMTVPHGFSVTVFAAEPDVHQPIAFTIDHRGRLWVLEAYTYPRRHPHPGPVIPDKKLGDKIVIFEDTNGDGRYDKRTVFFEGLNLASGLEVGFGGVWVGAAPYLLFIPHDETTDQPAGEPKILLDGWGYQDTHETLNSFIWGPDGWLYGCHGVFTHSRVGKPGTPVEQRIPINAGIWRYHPTRHIFEVVAHGTSNPWGLDYNAWGDFFCEACVIPHMWHIIPGGRYHRQAGSHFNPYTYADIQTIARHRHYVGPNPHAGNNRSDSAGGGHAHCGLMCYQGGAWPKEYHGKLFMGNLHGHRLNVDVIKPQGSGYVADRNPDFLLSHDRWFIPVAIKSGPDGNAYLLDWYDKQICHRTEPEIWDRTNGRIYKISYQGTPPVVSLNLKQCSDAELVRYLLHDNDWYARTARRLLQERYTSQQASNQQPETIKARQAVIHELMRMATAHPEESRRLRALWTIGSLGLTEPIPFLWQTLRDPSPAVRAWTIRWLSELDSRFWDNLPDPQSPSVSVLPHILPLAETDPSPLVRRELASATIRHATPARWAILERLLSHSEDAHDHNLPLLYWYALEPLCASDPATTLKLTARGKIPLVFALACRRIGALGTPEALNLLTQMLLDVNNEPQRLACFQGLREAAQGQRQLPMPRHWPAAFEILMKSTDAVVRQQALGLAATFGDKTALATLRKVLSDHQADTQARLAALNVLLQARDTEMVPLLQDVVAETPLRVAAIRALAAFDHPQTPRVLLHHYPRFNLQEKREVVTTLAARLSFARELMAALAAQKIPAVDIPAEIIRQLRSYNDDALNRQITELWGIVRDSPSERKALITQWRKRLRTSPPGDPMLGRAVFARTCQQCHILYGVGGQVGPEITGANRSNLDYLLENILDPNAVIPKEYAATRIVTIDDRTLIGIIKSEANGLLTLQTERELLTLPTAEIVERQPSQLSMMPDDIWRQLNDWEFRSLIAYLQTTQQVPMLATPDNAKDFFNGKDLNGWTGDRTLWSVEDGAIVGRTTSGLKRNNFLVSQVAVEDFKLSLQVKLIPNKENSGIQFRSVPLPDGEMRGPQADIGAGWWGKLYEESGRGLLAKGGGEKYVKPNDWNDYVIEAIGPRVRIWINGHLCTDYTDDKLARRGVVGLQLHSGGPMEIRFRNLRLEVYPTSQSDQPTNKK